uniref:B5R-1S peptide n=1 Tax=Homo sapiens TaxID=9606 RepID=Q9H325_HUMAN|nr:b5R-1S peptide [Homo sapiens]
MGGLSQHFVGSRPGVGPGVCQPHWENIGAWSAILNCGSPASQPGCECSATLTG